MDQPSTIDASLEVENEVIADPKTFKGYIEFKNVWFRYPSRSDVWVLKNFNMQIEPNETVALVGESGSGKSTIIQLIYRFYEPNFGKIIIDSIDIKRYNIKSLWKMFGLVQ